MGKAVSSFSAARASRYPPLAFFVWLGRKSRALSCDIAASANAPPLRVGGALGSAALPKFQPWACPRFLIPNFLRASAAWALRMAL